MIRPSDSREAWHRGVVAAILVLLLVLRVVRAFTLGANSDESQHLHVAWAWTQGLVVYRDVFDNHTPLFHALCAPLLALLGERADVLAWMRLTMIPLYFGTLLATWCIGRAVADARSGLYAALLAGTLPVFFDVSTQFRPDDLWALLWLGAVAVAVRAPPSKARAFGAGVLAGAAFATSAKTSLLVATAAFAGASLVLFDRRVRDACGRPHAMSLACGAAGALLVPVLVASYFVGQGAWREAAYGVFEHNLVPGLGRWRSGEWRFWLFPAGYALALAAIVILRPRHAATPPSRRADWVLLSAVAYLLALYAYWPLFTRQDLLPALPLLAVGLAARFVGGEAPRWRLAAGAVLLAALGLAIAAQTLAAPDRLCHAERDLARIFSLTRPGEYVMDAKGEAIFRPRPFHWVLEGVTEERLRNGSIRDDLAGRLAATATALVVDDRIPAPDRAFVEANYVPVGHRLRVAGRRLGRTEAGQPTAFRIAIAGDYRFVARAGDVTGVLDGRRIGGVAALQAGEHRFTPDAPTDVALVWAEALGRGLAPAAVFAPDAEDGACAP